MDTPTRPSYLPHLKKHAKWLLIGSLLHLSAPLLALIQTPAILLVSLPLMMCAQLIIIWGFWISYFEYFNDWLAYREALQDPATPMQKFREWILSGICIVGSLSFALMFFILILSGVLLFFINPGEFQSQFHIGKLG